ncbi:MAG: glycosyltransferase family 2 protein [Phycisphaeraceae bacterium]
MSGPDAGPVDLVIPARNEQANIPALLAALPPAGLRHVVVADNGSTDRTADLARAGGAVVVHEPQHGYGAACLAALRWIAEQDAPPIAVAFLDADLSDDPATLPRLWQPVLADEADLVLSDRTGHAERGALEPHQRFGTRLACTLLRWTTGRRYRDLGPMRVVRWTSLQRLAMADRTWGWTVEMQFKAARQGLRIREVEVDYRRRRAGTSKISGSLVGSAKAGWKILATIIALRLQRT